MPNDQHDERLISQVEEYYSNKVRTHGATPRGVDWNSQETQDLRFRQLSMLLPADNFSVTDLGCGYGAYYDYLDANHVGFEYVGVDVSQEMVNQAVSIHPQRSNCRFVCSSQPQGSTDYTVASGIFNVRQDIGDGQWLRYIHACLDDMNRSSARGFAFNCLTSHSDADRKRADLFYADPADMFNHCIRYSRHVTLLHDYGLYEFTIHVRKDPPR
jgi:SAM-dependent methyltransferase